MNQFWGKRFGYLHPVYGPVFVGKRGGKGNIGGNKGPTGYKSTPARLRARALAEMAASHRKVRRV